ncbi:helix-turn-helix domain-containing protein [Micromonospora sp. CPCC 205539]|uniref:helix-turn-helix transcriptional regulator n=1 Tax=Micromonospora sp. CPCC 205539 TaxID=3122408 RepID=UPI002FEF672A
MTEHVSYSALAVPSRRQLLDGIRTADHPLTVKELVTRTGMHPNTVRFHLEVLIEAGFVSGEPGRRHGRGRPQTIYRSVTPPVPASGYQFLSQVLAAQLDQSRAGGLAEEAGRSWLRPEGTPASPAPVADPVGAATTRALALFTELGFEPVGTSDSASGLIDLHACPFLDVAREHPDVVCGMHRGLLRELVDTTTPDVVAELVPFARPGVCVARLTRTLEGALPS